MTFITPSPDQLTNKIRCVVMFVPVDTADIFLSNLFGQYTTLIAPYSWNGSYQERGVISQLWQNAYSVTLDWLESGLCQEIIDDEGNMALNIDVNCGCGGGGSGGDCLPSVVVNNYNTSNSVCLPIPTAPVNPPTVPPLVPDGNGGYLPPPPVYPNDPPFTGTDPQYNQERCTLANYAYQYLLQWVSEAKNVDNALLGASAVILALNASGVAGVIAMLSRIGASELIQLASSLVGLVAAVPLWDEWVDDIIDVVESRKVDLICALYGTGDTQGAAEQWVQDTINEIISTWQARPDWSQNVFDLAFNYLTYLLPATPISAWARLNDVAINFVPDYDCSQCGAPPPTDPRIHLIPATNIAEGINHTPAVVDVTSNRASVYGDGTGLNNKVEIQTDQTQLAPAGGQFVGFGFVCTTASGDTDSRYQSEIQGSINNANFSNVAGGSSYATRDLAFTDQYILDYFATWDFVLAGTQNNDDWDMYTQDNMNQPNSAGFVIDVYYIYVVP